MSRRERVEHTEDWDQLEPRLRWDEQRATELREAHREKVARHLTRYESVRCGHSLLEDTKSRSN